MAPFGSSRLMWDLQKQVKQVGCDRSAAFASRVEDAYFAGRLAAVIMRPHELVDQLRPAQDPRLYP